MITNRSINTVGTTARPITTNKESTITDPEGTTQVTTTDDGSIVITIHVPRDRTNVSDTTEVSTTNGANIVTSTHEGISTITTTDGSVSHPTTGTTIGEPKMVDTCTVPSKAKGKILPVFDPM